MTTEEYKRALRYHDWYFDYSDDHSVWKQGWEERQRLERARAALDPDNVIWNEFAPDQYKMEAKHD